MADYARLPARPIVLGETTPCSEIRHRITPKGDLGHKLRAYFVKLSSNTRTKCSTINVDRDWELAILVLAQTRLVSKQDPLSDEEQRLFRTQARRIKQLLRQASEELPNWQQDYPAAGVASKRQN